MTLDIDTTSRGREKRRLAKQSRERGKWLAVLAAAAVAALIATATTVVVQSEDDTSPPSNNAGMIANPSFNTETIALGVWNPGVPWDMTQHDKYVAQVGKEPAVVLWYQSWGPGSHGEFCASCADRLSNRGYAQVLTWESKDYTRKLGYDQPDYSLKTIINGDHDAYIRRYARSVASWGKSIMLRFDHEMNGDWDPWGADVNGNQPEEYVASWKHVHDIFQQEGATNVEWVWSPNVRKPTYNDTTPFSAYYPGDAYVDWVALDGYNRGTSQSGSRWHSLEEVFGPSYEEITALTDKPLMIAETGSSEDGGDKAAWIRDGFLREIPQRFPRVKAVIYYNQEDDNQEDKEADFRLDSSAKALETFKEVANKYSSSPRTLEAFQGGDK